MTPRPDVAAVTAHTSARNVVRLLATGHSTLPVLGNRGDDVIGMISLRDALVVGPRPPRAIKACDIARQPMRVLQSSPLPNVLAAMRTAGENFACVVDESGRFEGVITPEDIAAEATAPSFESRLLLDVVRPWADLVSVESDAPVEIIRTAALSSGHSRMIVRRNARLTGVVHVRDAMRARRGIRADALARSPLLLSDDMSARSALCTMRADDSQLALVRSSASNVTAHDSADSTGLVDSTGLPQGFVTLDCLLDEILAMENELEMAA